MKDAGDRHITIEGFNRDKISSAVWAWRKLAFQSICSRLSCLFSGHPSASIAGFSFGETASKCTVVADNATTVNVGSLLTLSQFAMGNSPVSQIRSEFFGAVRDGNVGDVATLIDKFGSKHHLLKVVESDPAMKHNYETALVVAARYGHLEIVQLLLDNNADPNFTGDRTGDASANTHTPLHYAAQVRFTFCCKLHAHVRIIKTRLCIGW